MGSRIRHGLNVQQQRDSGFVPERNLLLAVLRRAILDLQGGDRELAEAAREWFQEGLETQDPLEFSFSWICQELGLRPDLVFENVQKRQDTAIPEEEGENSFVN